MKPVSPVFKPCDEITIGANQSPYTPLPAVPLGDIEGTILTRWHLSWRERLTALIHGDVYLFVMTFGGKLQPMSLQVERPEAARPGPEPEGRK